MQGHHSIGNQQYFLLLEAFGGCPAFISKWMVAKGYGFATLQRTKLDVGALRRASKWCAVFSSSGAFSRNDVRCFIGSLRCSSTRPFFPAAAGNLAWVARLFDAFFLLHASAVATSSGQVVVSWKKHLRFAFHL